MRVLLIPSAYPPRLGGVQTLTHNLARHLIKNGHQVQVVTNHYPRSLPIRERLDGVSVERILFLTPNVSALKRKRFDLFLASFYFCPSAHWRLRSIMRRFRPDVINVHFPDHQIPFVMALRREFDVRLVVSLHGYDIEAVTADESCLNGNGLRDSSYQRSSINRLRSILNEADTVTACSQYLLTKAIGVEPSISDKGRVIHNGIDPKRFENKASYEFGRPYFLAIGRLVHSKGFDMLLDAFARINSNVKLIIAGEGEEREVLENQARQLGLERRIHFFGAATPEQIVSLLNGSLLVVIPSRFESFGIVALEALAAGKPILASRVGGLPELLMSVRHQVEDRLSSTSDAGDKPLDQFMTLVEPTASALASGLTRVLCSNPHCDCDTKSLVANYSWERVVDEYEAVMMH